MPEFFETIMGRRFFESTMPKVAGSLDRIEKALARIADALEAANTDARRRSGVEQAEADLARGERR